MKKSSKKRKHKFDKKCGCLDCDVRYGTGQEELVEKIQNKCSCRKVKSK